jgi:hypothetical protein
MAKVILTRSNTLMEANKMKWRSIKEDPPPKGEIHIYYWRRNGNRSIGLAYMAVDGHWR